MQWSSSGVLLPRAAPECGGHSSVRPAGCRGRAWQSAGARKGRKMNLLVPARPPTVRDTISHIVDFVVRHSELLVFSYVFADQLGVPPPAIPALLGIGA